MRAFNLDLDGRNKNLGSIPARESYTCATSGHHDLGKAIRQRLRSFQGAIKCFNIGNPGQHFRFDCVDDDDVNERLKIGG